MVMDDDERKEVVLIKVGNVEKRVFGPRAQRRR